MAPTTSFMSIALLASSAAALPFDGFNFGGSGGPQHGAPWSSHHGKPEHPEPQVNGGGYPGAGVKPTGIPLLSGGSPAPYGYKPTAASDFAAPTGIASAVYTGYASPTGVAYPTSLPVGTGAFGIPSSAGAPYAPDATQWSRPVPPEEQGKPSHHGPGGHRFEGPRQAHAGDNHWSPAGYQPEPGQAFGQGWGNGFAAPSGVAIPSGRFPYPSGAAQVTGAGVGAAQPTGYTQPWNYPGAGQQQHGRPQGGEPHGPPFGGEQHGSPFGGQQHGPPAGFNPEAFPL